MVLVCCSALTIATNAWMYSRMAPPVFPCRVTCTFGTRVPRRTRGWAPNPFRWSDSPCSQNIPSSKLVTCCTRLKHPLLSSRYKNHLIRGDMSSHLVTGSWSTWVDGAVKSQPCRGDKEVRPPTSRASRSRKPSTSD
jgi:hypothetical protein